MLLEQEVKLDYSDVLIRPKRSTLGSRKEVDLERGFSFLNYTPYVNPDKAARWISSGTGTTQTLARCPIMAANMDGAGTFEMVKNLPNNIFSLV